MTDRPIGGFSTGRPQAGVALVSLRIVRRTAIGAGQRLAGGLITGSVAVVLMAGCSAEGQQASTELPSASSTSAEATPELPALGPPDLPMPEEARTRDATGAEAFLRYYIAIYNHAQQTMDSSYMREFSRSCETCDRIATGIDESNEAGQLYEGGTVRLDGLAKPLVQGNEAQLAFSVSQDVLVVTRDGKPVDGLRFPANSSTSDGAILTWSADLDSWRIVQWDTA